MKVSRRVPGYPMRYIGADKSYQSENTLQYLEVHGDGEVDIPVRTATPEDAELMGVKKKPSSLV